MSSTLVSRRRVIAYIDGFNLYYGLKHASQDSDYRHLMHGGSPSECLGRSLYWLDLQSVILSQIPRSDHCEAIKYFSAPRRVPALVEIPDSAPYIASNERQRVYLEALRTLPLVELILGWYSENEPGVCSKCGHRWPRFEEKMTDVNIATHMLSDAYEDRLDRAVLMSADADLVPAVEAVRRAGKEVLLLLPPGRKRAKNLRATASVTRNIKIRSLRDRLLPEVVEREGFPPLRRPAEWAKPAGWVWSTSPPDRADD